MISNLSSEAKRLINERMKDINKKPINKDVVGFKIHIVKAKREGYTQGMEDALKIIQSLEND